MTPVAPVIPRPTYRYWACDLKTGTRGDQVPLKASGPLTDRINSVQTVMFTADLAELQAGVDFYSSVVEGRTLIVCEREYEGDRVTDILWAGIVGLVEGGNDSTVNVSCSTIGSYFDGRYAATHTYTAIPGDTDGKILTDLLTDAAPEGINVTLDINCPTLRAQRYMAREYRTVLSCLTDLAALDGGPEWIFRASWVDTTRQQVKITFVARTRLGVASTAPAVTFDYPGNIRSYRTTGDYTKGHGANQVTATTGSGVPGDVARDAVGITGYGYPRWEQVLQKQGDQTVVALSSFATAEVAKSGRGEQTSTLVLDMTTGPQVWTDWTVGDDVLWVVYAFDSDSRPAPSYRHPAGFRQVVRVIGHQFDTVADTLTPILWSPYQGGP